MEWKKNWMAVIDSAILFNANSSINSHTHSQTLIDKLDLVDECFANRLYVERYVYQIILDKFRFKVNNQLLNKI